MEAEVAVVGIDRCVLEVADERDHGRPSDLADVVDGRQVLHFMPWRYDRWSQSLEVTLGELIPSGEPALFQAAQ